MNTIEFGSYVTLVLGRALSRFFGCHCLSLLTPLENVWFLTARETTRGSRLHVGLATVGAYIFSMAHGPTHTRAWS